MDKGTTSKLMFISEKIIFIEVALQMYQDFFSEGIITAQNIY